MEKVFLVGTHQKKRGTKAKESYESLEELARLVETSGGEVMGKTFQSISSPNPSTFIGQGKVEELRQTALRKNFSTLVFDDELKPAQQRNLAELIPVKILDRTRIILDIFAKRARTREGILQVELAQLSYMLPRITERYGRFEQQVGGIGTRGPGERKLEVEARHIRDRMAFLKRQIESVKMHREVARERRHSIPLPIITILGYTNAGKSTLLNSLVQYSGQPKEPIYADNKLFATLDPTTRRIKLPSSRWSLFTDTVGFIKKLPPHLVAAFRSTLEETLNADILIHLIDASDNNKEEHAQVVYDILKSLKPEEKHFEDRMITVYNKIDLVSESEKNRILKKTVPDIDHSDHLISQPIGISASQSAGLGKLLNSIEEKLSRQMIETDIHLPFEKMGILPSLYHLGKIERVDHKRRGIDLHIKLEKSHWAKLQKILQK